MSVNFQIKLLSAKCLHPKISYNIYSAFMSYVMARFVDKNIERVGL